jgi:hypothetical protein
MEVTDETREGGRFIPARRGRRKADRLGRAIELAALGHVVRIDEGWTVISADGAHFYRVSLDRCECPDATFRPGVRCKHRIALALAMRRLARLMRADPAKMNGETSPQTHELKLGRPLPFQDSGV